MSYRSPDNNNNIINKNNNDDNLTANKVATATAPTTKTTATTSPTGWKAFPPTLAKVAYRFKLGTHSALHTSPDQHTHRHTQTLMYLLFSVVLLFHRPLVV